MLPHKAPLADAQMIAGRRSIRIRFAVSAAALILGIGAGRPIAAAPRSDTTAAAAKKKVDTSLGSKSPTPAAPPTAEAPPAYEPQLLRLAEMLGALAYLQDLCGHHHDGQIWRIKMAALLDAEAKTPLRKARLAGAFNRGFRGYALTYRLCTPNAQAIISRFLDESGKLAHAVAHRYGPG